jgi:tetratricopeptide (TPR) repeat protein
MIRIFITILFMVLASMNGFSSPAPDSLIAAANTAYTEGNFQKATELYHAVIDQGYASSGLYYNLGNAHFKAGNIPSAILFYEKARKSDPKNEDINFNLSLANSRIIDKIEPVPEFFLKKWWRQVRQLMSSDSWARAIVILFVTLLLSASVFIVSRSVAIRRTFFWLGISIFFLTIISTVAGLQSHRALQSEVEGIVFTPTVTVKSSPAENSVDLFVIHEGTKVQILDRVEGWSEIRILNGSIGWIRQSDYQSI